MNSDHSKKYICDQDVPIDASFSVYPVSSAVSGSSLQLDIPAPELHTGKSFSVRSGVVTAYVWYEPTGRHFAEVFITVTAHFKRIVRSVRHFICQAVRSLTMTLLTRRPACLRL